MPSPETNLQLHLLLLLLVAAAVASAGAPSTASAGIWDCVFLHGGGVSQPGPNTPSFPSYWGNVAEHVPQCRTTAFNHANTTDRTFDDPELMRQYCAAAGANSSGVISNKIVFTHSMANTIVARALADGVCSFDSTVAWYNLGAPWHGSSAADVLVKLCADPSKLEAPLRWLLTEAKMCTKSGNITLEYWSFRPSYPGLQGLDAIGAKFSSGAICGTSAWGITSEFSIGMEAIAALAHYNEPNDGMVPLSSCNASWPAAQAAASPAQQLPSFYSAPLNHIDVCGRNGDDSKAQPLEWLGSRQGK